MGDSGCLGFTIKKRCHAKVTTAGGGVGLLVKDVLRHYSDQQQYSFGKADTKTTQEGGCECYFNT